MRCLEDNHPRPIDAEGLPTGRDSLGEMPLLVSLLHAHVVYVFVFDRGGALLRWNERTSLLLGETPVGAPADAVAAVLGCLGERAPVEEVFRVGTLVVEGPGPRGEGAAPGRRLAWVLHHIQGSELAVAVGMEEPRRKRVEEALERRLGFQQLATTISARFVNLPARDVDREIAEGLGMLGEFFHLERCTFAEVRANTKGYQPLHCWVASGIATPLDPDSRQFMPMLTERIQGGEPYFYSGRDEIPSNWVHERRFAEASGIQAALIVPLKVGGAFLGAFLIDSFSGERDWPSEMVDELRFIGGIFANAVARRRAEELLASSEKRVRMIANALPQLIAYVGGDRRYRFNNQAYEQWHGIPADAVYGKTMREVLGDATYKLAKPYVDKALKGVPVQYQMAVPMWRWEATRFIEASYVPHLDPGGQVLGFYSLVQDITDRKRVEMEVQRQRDELAHVTRVATLGEMAASMVHELNQPLAAIRSNAQAAERILAAEVPDLAEVRDALGEIIADDRRASEVIRRLRAFVVKGDHLAESIHLNALVEDVLFLVRHDANLHRCSITTHLAEGLPPTRGDRIQLQQVLLNLILNGFQAMSGNRSSRKLNVRTGSGANGELRVSVADCGPGIQAEHVDRIFDAFFTTKVDGMGMGLSIGRSILNAHGGRLWVETVPGQGSVFHISLPAGKEGGCP